MGFGTTFGQQYGTDELGEGGVAYSIRQDEVVSAVDAAGEVVSYARRADDTAAAADTVVTQEQSGIRCNDVATASDTLSKVVTYERRADDTAIAADTSLAIKGYLIPQQDEAVTASDTVLVNQDNFVRADDVATASDTLSKVVTYERSHGDLASAADSQAKVVHYSRSHSDSVTATDAYTEQELISLRRSDTVTATDSVSVVKTLARRASDSVTATDAARKTAGFNRRRNDSVTATDAYKEADTYIIRHDDVVTALDWASQTPRVYRIRCDEVVSAVDAAYRFFPRDFPTASPTKLRQYAPLADLGLVRSILTTQARHYIARGAHDGTLLVPTRFVLGSGWENPRWGEPPPPSSDATEVIHPVYEGDVDVEEANPTTLAVRCVGPEAPAFQVQESMIYAKILNSPYMDETYLEIPFACATFPEWFHAPGQRFVARLIIPL